MEEIIPMERERHPDAWLWMLIVSSALVFAGGQWAGYFIRPGTCTEGYFGFPGWIASWDGQWYSRIAASGYAHIPVMARYFPTVFFPMYPLLGAVVHAVSGLSVPLSLMLISLVSLAVFCRRWLSYCRLRLPGRDQAELSLLFFLFWPASYFLRLPYTESLFILLTALLLLGFEARAPLWKLCLIAGFSCAVRPPGAVCAAAVGYHALLRLREKSPPVRLAQAAGYAFCSAWGLWCYMAYLWLSQGNPLLFVIHQKAWDMAGAPHGPDAVFALLTLEPLRKMLEAGEWVPWKFMPTFLNKFLWLAEALLLSWGVFKRWLNREEIFVGAGMLLLAYVSTGAARDMASAGRYGLAALPVFLVLARLMAARGVIACASFAAASAAALCLSAGLFAELYCMY